MRWLGIDIGGANLKLADGESYAELYPFALWKQPRQLAFELRTLIAQAPPCDHLAVTMTGELADCFATKAEGVRFILDAVAEASDRRHTRVYLSNGMLVTPQVAARRSGEVAAANWHALARFAARFAKREPAIVIDVGSTTCDLVPIRDGQPGAVGRTDTERLMCGELLYTGVERSPLCALVDSVPFRSGDCPVAQEVFATTRDVYVILGKLPETTGTTWTTDGRPNTKVCARTRLARMICADSETFNHRDAVAVARAVADAQTRKIAAAIERLVSRMPAAPTTCVTAGLGEFLAQGALDLLPTIPQVISLGETLGPTRSYCAPAHALAVLAREGAGT